MWTILFRRDLFQLVITSLSLIFFLFVNTCKHSFNHSIVYGHKQNAHMVFFFFFIITDHFLIPSLSNLRANVKKKTKLLHKIMIENKLNDYGEKKVKKKKMILMMIDLKMTSMTTNISQWTINNSTDIWIPLNQTYFKWIRRYCNSCITT